MSLFLSQGVSQSNGLYSLLLAERGRVTQEEYFNGRTSEDLCHVQSLTKSIMSVLIGIAIDQELISNIDEPIVKYFPFLEDDKDSLKQEITIAHLLDQTSGLLWNGHLEHQEWLASEDPIQYVLSRRLENKPGVSYNYNSGATHLLSAIVSISSGESTLEFARKYLFDPLNIEKYKWEKRGEKYHDGSGLGLEMLPKDLLKIGLLMASNGKYFDQQLVSEEWVKRSFDSDKKQKTRWGIRESMHGMCWYSAEFESQRVNYGMGYGGQFILIFPKTEVVIVATHNHDTPRGIEQQIAFLQKKLPNLLKE